MPVSLTRTILDDIVRERIKDVECLKQATPIEIVQTRAAHTQRPRDFKAALSEPGIQLIAEVKRASPSKGVLKTNLNPAIFAQCYADNGAAAISVLTEKHFFHGTLDDLRSVKQAVPLPVLRKDFIFDPYQVFEARAAGADAVLLIAAILSDELMQELYVLVETLGMAALVEVHNAVELERVLKISPRIVGINNRDLKTFQVTLDTTTNLVSLIPGDVVTVAESGIQAKSDVVRLHTLAVDAILVGESIITAPDVGEKVRELCTVGKDPL